MYASIQTVCGCHGLLLFESIYCDRCRSLIPYQLSDESLIGPLATKDNLHVLINTKSVPAEKSAPDVLASYQKPKSQIATTGCVRFRALCPFCNSPSYVLRYYCRRERLYYHLRVQHFGESEQSIYKSISEIQNMNYTEKVDVKYNRSNSSTMTSGEDSYSLSDTTSQQPPSTIIYDQTGIQVLKDLHIKNEKSLYPFNDVEGDLFELLRNSLFYDTILQCQDGVKFQTHRCILGSRSPWFRNLISEHHNLETQGDYVLQISIDDVQSDVMNEVLNYMYTNRCLISLKNASGLLFVSKRFELEKLRRQVAEFLICRLSAENALDLLVSAHEAGAETLKLACIRIINRNAEKIKRTEKWKKFKADYVDLVPELYESRIERPPPIQPTYLPDVFTAPIVMSDSLNTLSQMYDNPVKQRAPSPKSRVAIPNTSRSLHANPNSTYHSNQKVYTHEPIIKETTGPFSHRHRSSHSSVADGEYPSKKRNVNNTPRRPVPQQTTAPTLTRTVFPTVKQPPQIETYRRPVNIYEKTGTQPATHQKQKPVNNHASPKPLQHVSPIPHTKVSKAMSPRTVIEVHQSPTLRDTSPEEQIILERALSTESME